MFSNYEILHTVMISHFSLANKINKINMQFFFKVSNTYEHVSPEIVRCTPFCPQIQRHRVVSLLTFDAPAMMNLVMFVCAATLRVTS